MQTKTLKLKACNSITLAHPQAPLGRSPSGAVIFEVTNIPDEVTTLQVMQRFSSSLSVYFGRQLSFDYATQTTQL